MKKFRFILLSLILILGLVACNNKEEANSETTETTETTEIAEVKEEKVEKENESEIEGEEARVIGGTVAVAQILDLLEYDNVVGVPESRYDLPERYVEAGIIGRPMEPDAEIVKSLNPDLFISVTSLEEANKPKMENLNIDTLFINLDSIDSILSSIEEVGQKINRQDLAEDIVGKMTQEILDLSNSTANKDLKILALFGSPSNISICTSNTYLGSLIDKLGYHNVAGDIISDSNMTYAPVNAEEIIKAEPDIILRMTHANPDEAKKMLDKEFQESDIWSNMTAVKEGKVIDLDNVHFGVSGNIKVVDALRVLQEEIDGKK